MDFLGLEVLDRKNKLKGIIIRHHERNPFVKYIRCWNPEEEQFIEYKTNVNYLEILRPNAATLQTSNLDDLNFWTVYEEAALEAALMTKDFVWAKEIAQACRTEIDF